ncbi:MAG: hypothetical protein GKS06_06015 [Acidobacteria bacterium]|nr:hypothetical protein [Acidobacteriota bacterium]
MLEALVAWIEASGPAVYLLAPLFTVAVAIPAEIPAMLNGMAFGPYWGTLVTWMSAMAGAQISFELAQRFGRPLAERFIPDAALVKTDRLVTRAGWPLLLGLRLLPTVAFTAINWGAGLTRMRRITFFWTTAVGILPGALVFTATGAGLGSLLSEAGGPTLTVAATFATIIVMAVMTVWLFRSSTAE